MDALPTTSMQSFNLLIKMPITKTISGLAERIGAGTADFGDRLAEGVRDFSCGLWELYPDYITENKSVGTSFARGVMNRVCADKTLPAPPMPMFIGGQCSGVNYIIQIDYEFFSNFDPGTIIPASQVIFGTPGLQGAITSIVGTKQGSQRIKVDVIFEDGNNSTSNETNPVGATNTIVDNSWTFTVTRADGQPDTCGDPPPEYPPTNPNPAVDFVTNININTEDGDTLTFPLIYAPINFTFPLNFDLGGLNVTLDLGGINFNFSLVSVDGLPLPLPDGQPPALPAPIDDGNRSIPCRRPLPPNNTNYDEDDKSESDPKEEDVGETLAFVRVTLTSVPVNVKQQFGDGAPNVIYAGWFEFQGEGYNFPRQPIHFTNSLFATPEGATGYAYTLYNGIEGKATIYTIKQEV